MSLSLYRRWRPRTFADLVGQDAVVRTLQTALSSGKLAHAYLFSGPRGSGKTSAAKIMARCVECEAGPAPEPDNTCENCLAILAGTALDVLEIDAASNRGIDEIRALRESVKFAPANMRYKVYIIDEAHMLTREGANAFLKTLEEPPPHAIFILATTAPEALPPTILSRCQRYAFRRIPIPTMIGRMREIATAEEFDIADDALGAIAYRADGGLRDALTMLEQVAAFAGPGARIDAQTVEAAFGTTGRVHARALLDALLAGDAGEALRTIDAASDAGADMLGLMRTTIGEFRNLMVGRIDPDLLARDLSPEDAERSRALAHSTPQARIVRALRLLADALAAGRNSGNPRLELETAALRFVLQGEDATLEALTQRVAALEGTGGVVPALTKSASAASAAKPADAAQAKPTNAAAVAQSAHAPLPKKPADDARGKPAHVAAPEAPDTVSALRAGAAGVTPASAAPPKTLETPPVIPAAADRATSADAPAALAPPVTAALAESVAAPVPPPALVPAMSDAGPPTLQRVRAMWDQIRTRIYEKAAPLRSPLSRATVDSLEDGTVTITIIDPLLEDRVREKQGLIEAAMADLLGAPLKVAIRCSNDRQPTASGGRLSSAHRAPPPAVAAAPVASAGEAGGEPGLMEYARQKLAGSPSEETQ